MVLKMFFEFYNKAHFLNFSSRISVLVISFRVLKNSNILTQSTFLFSVLEKIIRKLKRYGAVRPSIGDEKICKMKNSKEANFNPEKKLLV